jgi:hypothetical protein
MMMLGQTTLLPQHYGIVPPPTPWPESMQFQWWEWEDFKFYGGVDWNETPLDWYLAQLGDA